MTTLESTTWVQSPLQDELELLPETRQSLTDAMQTVARPGLQSLSAYEYAALTELTGQLVTRYGAQAASEYDRYCGVEDRGLDIDRDAIAERICGKTVLVTGGTGLIGSQLMTELSTFGPLRLVSVSRGETEPHQVVAGAEYYRVDVRDKEKIEDLMQAVRPDLVFHVAADKYNHDAESRAQHTLTTNIEGTLNVIKTAEEAGVAQLVYASTGKATRPFSPDIYASSKKAGEYLMAQAAARGRLLCSAVRFTHVVDDSNVRHKINERIEADMPVKLQSPDVLFYIQSAKESAHLLLNSLLEANPDKLKIQAIRDLALPMNLLDLGLGAITKSGKSIPIYFGGVEQGYEDKAWPGLYDPMNGGEVSPLINAIEASDAEESVHCTAVDTFTLDIAPTSAVQQQFDELLAACHTLSDNGQLRVRNQGLSWAMLEARIHRLPDTVLARVAKRAAKFALTEVLNEEHEQTNILFVQAHSERQAAASLSA